MRRKRFGRLPKVDRVIEWMNATHCRHQPATVNGRVKSDPRLTKYEMRGSSAKRAAALADDLDILLYDLCVHWGFCNQLTGHALAQDGRQLSAEDFAMAVLVAEGFPQPELELEWLRKFKRLFVERYGQTVSASDYVTR